MADGAGYASLSVHREQDKAIDEAIGDPEAQYGLLTGATTIGGVVVVEDPGPATWRPITVARLSG